MAPDLLFWAKTALKWRHALWTARELGALAIRVSSENFHPCLSRIDAEGGNCVTQIAPGSRTLHGRRAPYYDRAEANSAVVKSWVRNRKIDPAKDEVGAALIALGLFELVSPDFYSAK